MDWLTRRCRGRANRQFGTNADAVQYFPLVQGRAAQGLVCVNHEYFSAELVFPEHRGVGMKPEERKRWMERHPHGDAVHADRAWRGGPGTASRQQGLDTQQGFELHAENHRADADGNLRPGARPHAHAHQGRSRRRRVCSELSRIAPPARRRGAPISPPKKTSTIIFPARAPCTTRRRTRRGSTPCAASRIARTASTAGTTRIRASTCATSPTNPCASAGWWKSIRTIRAPCRASAPRSDASSTKAPIPSSARPATSPPTWVTTRSSNTSTSS